MASTIDRLVLLALISAVTGPTFAKKPHPPVPAGSIEWRQPLAGAVLVGGGSARLEWHPGPLFGELFAVKDVVAMDLVELAPLTGQPASDFLAAKLVYKCLGHRAARS